MIYDDVTTFEEKISICFRSINSFRKVLEKEDKALPENASTTADPEHLR